MTPILASLTFAPAGGTRFHRTCGLCQPAKSCYPVLSFRELLYGGLRTKKPSNFADAQTFCSGFAWIPFDAPAAQLHAQLRADLDTRNARIGPYDSIIAATALANALTVVTHNTREFGRVPGLKIVDWFIP